MPAEFHIKEIRDRITSLLDTDLDSYSAGYLVSDRRSILLQSGDTVLVTPSRVRRVAKQINDLRLQYEFHAFVRSLRLDPDDARDVMDVFLARVVKSIESHSTLNAFKAASKEEVFNCYVDEVDETRGPDGSNNYLIVNRVKILVFTSQTGS